MKRLEQKKGTVVIKGNCMYGQAMSLVIEGVETVFIAPSLVDLARLKKHFFPESELIEDRTSRVVFCGVERVVEDK